MAIIISKNTLDMAYPPLILASTAAAMDMEVSVLFTFWGMDIIDRHKIDSLEMPNPATVALKDRLTEAKVPTPREMLSMCLEAGVKIYPCQMTMRLFGLKREDLVSGAEPSVGAATFLDIATNSDTTTLFI